MDTGTVETTQSRRETWHGLSLWSPRRGRPPNISLLEFCHSYCFQLQSGWQFVKQPQDICTDREPAEGCQGQRGQVGTHQVAARMLGTRWGGAHLRWSDGAWLEKWGKVQGLVGWGKGCADFLSADRSIDHTGIRHRFRHVVLRHGAEPLQAPVSRVA